jgi:hypothetical protein
MGACLIVSIVLLLALIASVFRLSTIEPEIPVGQKLIVPKKPNLFHLASSHLIQFHFLGCLFERNDVVVWCSKILQSTVV